VKIVSLDLHAEASQMFVRDDSGEILREMRIPTNREQLRRAVSEIPGEKYVVFEEGPLSSMVSEALQDLAEEVVSCDPARNALIARDEDSDDERDARHLEKLFRLEAVRPVYIPEEPYLSLRSVLKHRTALQRSATGVKNRIKALARRCDVGAGGKTLYESEKRSTALQQIDSEQMQWQMKSLWRQLDMLSAELQESEREARKLTHRIPAVRRLRTIPGVGFVTSATLVAWIADPRRFKNRSALSAYGGLGLSQKETNWEPTGPAQASRRGNRQLKRVLFLAATAAGRTDSALGFRYRARRRQGWNEIRSKRDVARKILHISWALWRKGTEYDDELVNGPQIGSRS